MNAARFIETLTAHVERIAELRLPGAPRDWITPGLRAAPFRRYCVYFRIDGDDAVILRILHGARDVGSQPF